MKQLGQFIGWLQRPEVLAWLVGLSVMLFLASLVVLPLVVTRMSADTFTRPRGRGPWARAHPVLRQILTVAKNLAGFVLVLAGVLMLLLPGQGLLSILMGLSLMDFPGKRGLELSLVRRPRVFKAINWMRAKAGAPPLQLPPR